MASHRIMARYGRLYGGLYIDVGHSPIDVAQGMLAATDVVSTTPNLLLWVYPQGDHFLPNAPLVFQPGVERLRRRISDIPTYSVGIRYAMYRRDRPACAVAFARVPTGASEISEFEQCSRDAMDRADRILEMHASEITKIF